MREVHERHHNSCGEWDLQQQFRREEDRVRQQNEDAVKLARRRTGRAYRKHLHLPTSLQDARDSLADMIESQRMFADDPQVIVLREWIQTTCAAHAIEVREDAAPQLRNGSAVRKLRRITIAPVQSLETGAVAGHEAAHVLAEIDPNAPSKPGNFGLTTICVSWEISAWQWVLANIPVWERPMHQRMTECLASYRPNATSEKARAIDEICGDISFRRVQLRIMTTTGAMK